MRNMLVMMMVAAVVLTTGCSSRRQVVRIDPGTQIDLSGRWNDTDAQLVADGMITDSLARPWLVEYVSATNRRPVVIVGEILNKTTEHISTDVFIRDIERAFVNSGNVRVVQAGDAREQLRAERADQQEFASPETMKRWGQELGADFILQGIINSITDSYRNERTVTYQIDLEMTSIQTNEKVWIGSTEIKKSITN